MEAQHHSRPLQCITFSLAFTQMAINILDIREIISEIKITPVHQAPEFVSGLMNLRGQIFTILDISVLLGFEKCRLGRGSHVIVFKNKPVGFVVDRIGDVIDIKPEKMEALPINMDEKAAAFTDRILNLGDQIAMLINAKKIVSHTVAGSRTTRTADEF